MAMRASLIVDNNSGDDLKIVSIFKLNDDAEFSGVTLGQVLSDGGFAQLYMGNNSFGLAPKGVGVQLTLVNLTASRYISVYLTIPASGPTTFEGRSADGIGMEGAVPRFGQDFTAKLVKA